MKTITDLINFFERLNKGPLDGLFKYEIQTHPGWRTVAILDGSDMFKSCIDLVYRSNNGSEHSPALIHREQFDDEDLRSYLTAEAVVYYNGTATAFECKAKALAFYCECEVDNTLEILNAQIGWHEIGRAHV